MSDYLEQLGYNQAAQQGALSSEQRQQVKAPDLTKLGLSDLAAVGRGSKAYLDDYYALGDANAFDYAQAGLGGVAGGFVGGLATLGGMASY